MNLANINYEEKRDFIRVKVNTPVTLKLNKDTIIKGTCHNLSGGGMLVSIDEQLSMGVNLEVTVSSSHSHKPMLKALTTVRRIGNIGHKGCAHGLKIEEVID